VVIVGGRFEVDPAQREAFLAGRLDMMRASRAEPGCLEYTFVADPIEPNRVVLFERWESQEALDTHLAALRSAPPPAAPGVAPSSMSITIYDVAGERPLA
jgi:quinol monooxygenase YgiN